MNRSRPMTMLRRMAFAVALAATSAMTAGCVGAEIDGGPDYPVGDNSAYGDYPPDAYIATTEPVYFGGYASYWYGGRWYYRNGGRWNHYDREPAGLYQRRMQGAQRRRTYESHPAGHSPGRGGGGRSGGRR
jgi:hypothetical protein